jgi:hypothetical protein
MHFVEAAAAAERRFDTRYDLSYETYGDAQRRRPTPC